LFKNNRSAEEYSDQAEDTERDECNHEDGHRFPPTLHCEGRGTGGR
jgi:hypothetical protein